MSLSKVGSCCLLDCIWKHVLCADTYGCFDDDSYSQRSVSREFGCPDVFELAGEDCMLCSCPQSASPVSCCCDKSYSSDMASDKTPGQRFQECTAITAHSLQANSLFHPKATNAVDTGPVSKRGRPLTKPLRGRHAESAAASSGPSRGRPPLSRQASRLHSDSADHHDSYDNAAASSTPASPLEEDELAPTGEVTGLEQRHEAPVDILAAAAATLAGCRKDKQGMLPMWGHKGRRSQGHDVSPVSEEAEAGSPMQKERTVVDGVYMGMQQQSENTGRSLRPRAAKKPRSS